jgi:hypothetical protein
MMTLFRQGPHVTPACACAPAPQMLEWSLPEDIERLRANRRKDMGFSEKLELSDDSGVPPAAAVPAPIPFLLPRPHTLL